MKLTIHRQNYGVTPEGDWYQKIDGEWNQISEPIWYKKRKTEKVVEITDLRMKPPRTDLKPAMVTVYRIQEKTVPDYEAEVLCRNGWQNYRPGSLRHYSEENDSAELSMG